MKEKHDCLLCHSTGRLNNLEIFWPVVLKLWLDCDKHQLCWQYKCHSMFLSWSSTHLVSFPCLLWLWEGSDIFFLEYSRALWSTNVYGEHSKRADIKPSYLHVLLPFSSYIRATHSGQLPLLGDGRDQGTVPLPTPCWKKRSAKDKASEGFSGFLLVKKKGTGRIS